jgi:uncharacterized membrane protein
MFRFVKEPVVSSRRLSKIMWYLLGLILVIAKVILARRSYPMLKQRGFPGVLKRFALIILPDFHTK